MGRGNDAIPSWSGFNYQGKMALLCTLEEINGGNANRDYKLSLEEIEDYAIFKDNGKALKLFQAKATLSENKKNHYTEYKGKDGLTIVQKLLNHKSANNCEDAECVLVVAVDINDWTVKNKYKNDITLYKRSGKAVGIKNVKNEIITEIRKYLYMNGVTVTNTLIVDTVYLNLCNLIDEKVAEIHDVDKNNRNYCISFGNIEDSIKNSIDSQIVAEKAYLRECVYEFVTDKMVDAYEKFLNREKTGQYDGKAVEYYLELALRKADIESFVRSLSPDNIKWDNNVEYASKIDEEKIIREIYEIIAVSFCNDSLREEHGVIFFDSDLTTIPYSAVVPTLMELKKSRLTGSQSISSSLYNIDNNYSLKPEISGKTLLYDGDVLPYDTLRKNSIKYVGVDNYQPQLAPKINEVYEDIGLKNIEVYIDDCLGGSCCE